MFGARTPRHLPERPAFRRTHVPSNLTPPGGGRVRSIDPIPLCLFIRRVVDHRVRLCGRGQAGLADRPEFQLADLAMQGLIRHRITEVFELVAEGTDHTDAGRRSGVR